MLFSFNAYDDKFIVFAYGILLKQDKNQKKREFEV